MEFKTISNIALLALVFILGVSIKVGGNLSKELKEEEREKRELVSKHKKIIKEQQLKRIEEIKLREEARKKDSVTISELRGLKKRDSLISIREIRILRKQFKKYSSTQLDSILIKEYEKATSSSDN